MAIRDNLHNKSLFAEKAQHAETATKATDGRNIAATLGNMGGINAMYFNQSENTSWKSTITDCNDIPIGYQGYCYSSMDNSPGDGIIECLGTFNNAYKIQKFINVYGGRKKYRCFKSGSWGSWNDEVLMSEFTALMNRVEVLENMVALINSALPVSIEINETENTINFIDRVVTANADTD